MAINFDNIPKTKPNSFPTVEAGRHLAVVEKTEMIDKDGSQYLRVSFKTKEGAFVNENYFDSDKPFVLYKLSRLLKACNVTLEGTGTLADVAKLVKGKKVVIDVVLNDRGYAGLDFSDNKEGVYARDEVVTTEEPTVEAAVEEAIASEDDDF